MKNIITLILGLTLAHSSIAECYNFEFRLFPKGPSIKQNSIFVMDCIYDWRDIVLGLNSKYNIYLKSGDKKVKLIVTEICVGQVGLTQAVLKPEHKLQAGLEYTMYIDNLPGYKKLRKWNNNTLKYDSVKYKVVAENDYERPQVNGKPQEIGKTLEYYGCGISTYVVFSNPAKDNSEIIIKTSFKNLKTGKETSFYIQPVDNKIKVGHGMCSGAFDFDGSTYYEVAFSFMDVCGNLTKWKGKRLQFTKPTERTEYTIGGAE